MKFRMRKGSGTKSLVKFRMRKEQRNESTAESQDEERLGKLKFI
jgi:hypothetical protein